MEMVLRRPAIPEETYGDEQGGRDHKRDAVFGDPCIGLCGAQAYATSFQAVVNPVVEWSADLGCSDEADAKGYIIETCDGNGFVVAFAPEVGKGRDDEEHEAIQVEHEEREDLDNGLGREEDDGTDEGVGKDLTDGAVRLLVRAAKVRVAGLFSQASGFFAEDGRRIRLPKEDQTGGDDYSVCY